MNCKFCNKPLNKQRVKEGGKFCNKNCYGNWMIGKPAVHPFEKGHKSWNKGRTDLKPSWNKDLKLPQFSGENNGNWKGGRKKTVAGYILIRETSHPFVNAYGYVPEHRLIMEKLIKRYLTSEEIVHHINGIKNDNRINNLKLMLDKDHRRLHLKDNVHKRWQKLQRTT